MPLSTETKTALTQGVVFSAVQMLTTAAVLWAVNLWGDGLGDDTRETLQYLAALIGAVVGIATNILFLFGLFHLGTWASKRVKERMLSPASESTKKTTQSIRGRLRSKSLDKSERERLDRRLEDWTRHAETLQRLEAAAANPKTALHLLLTGIPDPPEDSN